MFSLSNEQINREHYQTGKLSEYKIANVAETSSY